MAFMEIKQKTSAFQLPGAPNKGGGVGGVSTPPEFWMGGLNTCQPPLILRKKFLGGVGSP